MKDKILAFADWSKKNWLEVVIIMSIIMMAFLVFVLFCWAFGFWWNGIHGNHDFDLSSCLTGIGAICTGLGLIIALAKAAWTKYGMDSRFNTPIGQPINSYVNKGKE